MPSFCIYLQSITDIPDRKPSIAETIGSHGAIGLEMGFSQLKKGSKFVHGFAKGLYKKAQEKAREVTGEQQEAQLSPQKQKQEKKMSINGDTSSEEPTTISDADKRSHLFSPSVEIQLRNKEGQSKGEKMRTSTRRRSRNPVWMVHLEVPVDAHETDYLSIQLFSEDMLQISKHVGSAVVSVKHLISSISSFELTMDVEYTDTAKTTTPCKIWLRREMVKEETFTKTVFFIRHGESKWNAAQQNKNVTGLLNFDHPLNPEGARQCRSLNSAWKRAQLKTTPPPPITTTTTTTTTLMTTMTTPTTTTTTILPATTAPTPIAETPTTTTTTTDSADNKCVVDCVEQLTRFEEIFLTTLCAISSPLTRAIQSAQISLQGHPAVEEGRLLHLRSCVREFRNSALSLDVTGRWIGSDIEPQVRQKSREILGDVGVKQIKVNIDVGDATSEWWSSLKEPKSRILARLDTTMAMIKHHPEQSMIITGHSVFFKEFCKHFADLNAIEKSGNTLFAEKLGGAHARKMENGACLGINIHFNKNEKPRIVAAKMLFGTTLHEIPDDDDDEIEN